MKKIYYTILCGLLISASSCKKYLDINDKNPNNLTTAGVDLILPQALAQTAASSVTFNSYGAWVGGNQANAGGFGGFGSVLTYNYTTSDNTGLWSESYDNINDYQTVINKSTATGPYKNFNAAARIMKAFAYQRLVDVYGDVPYSQAVQGLKNLTPAYDKAEDIYKDLFAQLDTAVTSFKLADDPNKTIALGKGVNGTIDIIYGGSAKSWIQFANTLRLRLLIRIQNASSMAAVVAAQKTKLAGLGDADFITTDVLVQPGYVKQAGKQNPAYNTYAYDANGTATQTSRIPTLYAKDFYQGKIDDAVRFTYIYQNTSVFNQLGYTGSDAPSAPGGGQWYKGENATGVTKGPIAAYPIMLLSEGFFLQAEAKLNNITSGDASASFKAGIKESFNYLQRKADGSNGDTTKLDTLVKHYISDNVESPLVNWEVAASPAQKLEAIITQKWIALNYVTSNEAWAEYRRTGYPVSTSDKSAQNSFASLQTTSTRPDRLPVRVLYPASEYSLNASHAPAGVNPFTSRIFWDAN